MKHLVGFDIDGTIVDTFALNRKAYHLAGVDMPDYAFGLPWRTWLINLVGPADADRVHTMKVGIYATMLESMNLSRYALSPLYLAREMIRRTDVQVRFLTSGSMRTAKIILNHFDLKAPLLAGLTYEQRRLALHSAVLATTGSVTYIDDSLDNVRRLDDDLLGVTMIHYTGQTTDELRARIRGLTGVKS